MINVILDTLFPPKKKAHFLSTRGTGTNRSGSQWEHAVGPRLGSGSARRRGWETDGR